tara:strand:+ start:50 stop:1897 length:1848 start_codon:yes stop_codon:yes gene_type:complete
MPLSRYTFQPGINKEGTSYSNEGGWYDCDKIRFRAGRPEKIGGWTKNTSDTFLGSCRRLHQWVALNGDKFIGLGTNLKLYIKQGSSFYDVTPIRSTTSAGDVTFSATDGDATITVADTAHGAVVNDFVTFSGAATLGGLITATVLNQEYQIASIVNANSYTIEAKDTDGDTVTANGSDSGSGGGSTVGAYQINTGLDSYVSGFGYGSGYWGQSEWGGGTAGFASQLRLWTIDNFGEDMIANPRGGGLFYWDKSSGVSTRAVNFSALSGAADVPTIASQVIVSETDRHIIALGANTIGTSTQDPMLVRWCNQEDAAVWTPKTTNTAGGLRLSAGSKIIGASRTREEIIIFTDIALYSMQFIGPPFTFSINLITESVSMVSPQASINANNAIYFMDEDNFYIYEGSIQTLPCSVRAYVFDDFNYGQVYKVFATRNAKFNEVTWFYCSSSSTEIDRYVTYNYLDKVWHIGTMSRTAWIDIGSSTIAPLSAGVSGTGTNYLYDQETGSNADGSALTAYIESADFDAGDGNQFMFINRLIPDIYFYGTSADPSVTYSIKTRNYPLGTLVTATTASVGSTTGVSNIRARARQMRVRIESTDSDNLWRLGDTRFDIRNDGRR